MSAAKELLSIGWDDDLDRRVRTLFAHALAEQTTLNMSTPEMIQHTRGQIALRAAEYVRHLLTELRAAEIPTLDADVLHFVPDTAPPGR